jgi:hypothetical protein
MSRKTQKVMNGGSVQRDHRLGSIKVLAQASTPPPPKPKPRRPAPAPPQPPPTAEQAQKKINGATSSKSGQIMARLSTSSASSASSTNSELKQEKKNKQIRTMLANLETLKRTNSKLPPKHNSQETIHKIAEELKKRTDNGLSYVIKYDRFKELESQLAKLRQQHSESTSSPATKILLEEQSSKQLNNMRTKLATMTNASERTKALDEFKKSLVFSDFHLLYSDKGKDKLKKAEEIQAKLRELQNTNTNSFNVDILSLRSKMKKPYKELLEVQFGNPKNQNEIKKGIADKYKLNPGEIKLLLNSQTEAFKNEATKKMFKDIYTFDQKSKVLQEELQKQNKYDAFLKKSTDIASRNKEKNLSNKITKVNDYKLLMYGTDADKAKFAAEHKLDPNEMELYKLQKIIEYETIAEDTKIFNKEKGEFTKEFLNYLQEEIYTPGRNQHIKNRPAMLEKIRQTKNKQKAEAFRKFLRDQNEKYNFFGAPELVKGPSNKQLENLNTARKKGTPKFLPSGFGAEVVKGTAMNVSRLVSGQTNTLRLLEELPQNMNIPTDRNRPNYIETGKLIANAEKLSKKTNNPEIEAQAKELRKYLSNYGNSIGIEYLQNVTNKLNVLGEKNLNNQTVVLGEGEKLFSRPKSAFQNALLTAKKTLKTSKISTANRSAPNLKLFGNNANKAEKTGTQMEFVPKSARTKPKPPIRSNSLRPAIGLLNNMNSFQPQPGNTGSPFKKNGITAMNFKTAINKARRVQTMKTQNAAMNRTNVASVMQRLINASPDSTV